MRLKNINERGQALIIITLAAIGLFAIVGLAIDGSAKFSDRRHAQNAADTAVMAAALAKIDGMAAGLSNSPVECPPPSGLPSEVCAALQLDGLDRAASNGYDNITNNTVNIYSPPISGAYAGDSAYVQVIINSDVNTLFARVIGINQTHNTVQAVAYTKKRGPFYDGALVVALNPNPCSGAGADGNITLGTSGGSDGIINLVGGGAFVNSQEGSCGITLTGCPTITVTDGVIASAGTGNVDLENSSGTCSSNVTGVEEPLYGQEPYPFPPDMPDEPSECVSPAGTFSSNSTTRITTLNPGRYNEFPPKSGGGVTVYDKIVMNPGIYCVNDVIKLTDQHLYLTGIDVTIYIRSGYSFSFSGGTIQLDAPDEGDYAGYVIIVDENDWASSPENCKIDGNGENTFIGTIFAPHCNLTVNGTSEDTSYSAQIIAYTVKLNGSAAVNLYYDEGDNAKNYPKIGLMK